MNGFLRFCAAMLVAVPAFAESLRVVNEAGQPVAGATIMLGYEAGNPFNGNILRTGADGSVGIPTDWKAALPVTVQAPGMITETIPVLMPGEHLITVQKQEGNANLEVKGTTTDFPRLITDGKVDFGMVIPSMSRESMLAFDISNVMSPQNDTIEIIGNTVNIPSNITLPRQEESYIFPITLDKPDYRVYVREPGQYQMYALHGQFPLQRVVNDIRGGKSLFEVINHFTFIQAGQRDVNVTGNLRGVNMPVNQVAFNSSVQVKAPAFPNDKVMIGLNLAERNGLFVPSDLKRFTPNQTLALKANATLDTGYVLSLLLDQPKASPATRLDETLRQFVSPLTTLGMVPMVESAIKPLAEYNFSKMTFAFMPVAGTVQPQFLPMIGKPQIVGNVMKLGVPTLPNGLSAAATYMVLAEVEELGSGNMKSERRTRMWEIWNSGFISQMEMPRLTFTKRPDRKYRWEVMFLARPSNFVFAELPGERVDLNTVTHVTRNVLEL